MAGTLTAAGAATTAGAVVTAVLVVVVGARSMRLSMFGAELQILETPVSIFTHGDELSLQRNAAGYMKRMFWRIANEIFLDFGGSVPSLQLIIDSIR